MRPLVSARHLRNAGHVRLASGVSGQKSVVFDVFVISAPRRRLSGQGRESSSSFLEPSETEAENLGLLINAFDYPRMIMYTFLYVNSQYLTVLKSLSSLLQIAKLAQKYQ